jgi:phosphoribosylformimino-5-aminoimidazole carboxamide ribotide isomerase
MDVVPVIDLKEGLVVHARRGERDRYRPIETLLSPTARPLDVVAGLLRLAPFRRLYVADLDAIAGCGDHDATLEAIAVAHSNLELCVDNGIGTDAGARTWLARGLGTLVLGSESQSSPDVVRSLVDDPRTMLSLDFRGDAFQGPPQLLDDPACWPTRLIVMTLARVGAEAGPDVDRVRAVAARANGRSVYAAGGVRDRGDLDALAVCGAAGVLVATALHSGALSAHDLT